jgi:hypothetical protein
MPKPKQTIRALPRASSADTPPGPLPSLEWFARPPGAVDRFREADGALFPLSVSDQPRTDTVNSAQRESINAALRALWDGTPPKGIQVKRRDDQIQGWQKDNGRVVTSQRTNRRFFRGR